MKLMILLIALGMTQECAAQVCPPTISARLQAEQELSAWTIDQRSETFYLKGVTIIEGPIAKTRSDREFELAPQESSGKQVWRFSRPVGNEEMWMRCWYDGTSLTLSSRLQPEVTECHRTSVPGANGRTLFVGAQCSRKEMASRPMTQWFLRRVWTHFVKHLLAPLSIRQLTTSALEQSKMGPVPIFPA